MVCTGDSVQLRMGAHSNEGLVDIEQSQMVSLIHAELPPSCLLQHTREIRLETDRGDSLQMLSVWCTE